jgi:uncharacterized protein DUF6932
MFSFRWLASRPRYPTLFCSTFPTAEHTVKLTPSGSAVFEGTYGTASVQRGGGPSAQCLPCNSGQGSIQRCAVADRLNRLYQLAGSTKQLARFVVFGSFVTAKAEPNDVDIVLLMEDTFDLAAIAGEAALLFQHMEADAHFGASVFWTKRSGLLAGSKP